MAYDQTEFEEAAFLYYDNPEAGIARFKKVAESFVEKHVPTANAQQVP